MMVQQDRAKEVSQICTGKREAKEKAEAMFGVIEDPVFWHSILRYVSATCVQAVNGIEFSISD